MRNFVLFCFVEFQLVEFQLSLLRQLKTLQSNENFLPLPCLAIFLINTSLAKFIKNDSLLYFPSQGSCYCQAIAAVLVVSAFVCLRKVELKRIFCDLWFYILYLKANDCVE